MVYMDKRSKKVTSNSWNLQTSFDANNNYLRTQAQNVSKKKNQAQNFL
jgi:hypothetical protein